MVGKHPLSYTGRKFGSATQAGDVQFNSSHFTVAEGIVSIASGSFTTIAAATDTSITTPSSAQILIYDGSNSWDNKTVSGDATISAAGAVSVSDLTIASEAQGDILYRNAANWVRLAAGTSGQFLKTQGAGANPVWASNSSADKLVSGFTLEGGTYDPATTITTQTGSAAALTIPDLGGTASEWVFSNATQTLANKTLTSPKILTTGAICDGGGDEYIVFTEDTTPVTYIGITSGDTGVAPIVSGAGETNTHLMLKGTGTGNVQIADGGDITAIVQFELDGATTGKTMTLTHSHTDDRTVTFPDATTTLVGTDTTQTLTNKTLTAPKIATTGFIADGGGDEYLKFVEADTPVTYLQITSGNTTVAPKLQGAGETNTDLHLLGSGTGNVYLSDGTDPTKDITFELNGATTGKTMTIISSQSDDRSLTLPNATDTLVGKATTDTFTNKTIDADGSGNVISNINMDEMDPVTAPSAGDGSDSVYGTTGVIYVNISNQGAAVNVYSSNAPFKFIVLDAWSVNKSADGGTWKIDNGTNDLCSAVTVAASDDDIDRIVDLDDAYTTIAANGSLRVVPDAGGALDADIYIKILRLA